MSHAKLLDCARRQIEFARTYTLSLLEAVDESLWFTCPDGCPSHIAWQVGHLATTEYFLTVYRVRGRQRSDNDVIPKDFLRRFAKGTSAVADPDAYPTPEQLREVLHAVHELALRELPQFTQEQLDESAVEPYAGYPTKLGSLFFCAQHEMLHAGQIGLIRRQLGLPPVR